MKQIFKSINPKHLLKSLKSKSLKSSSSISKSSPPSFSSTTSSTTSSSSTATVSSTVNHLHQRSRSDDALTFKFDVVSAFQILDRNGDGKIDKSELKSLFNKSVTDEELGEMIKEIDRDGDGCISLDELQAVGSVFESTAREEEVELRAAFEFFDSDNDGRISAVELYQGFVKLGDQRCTLEDCRRIIEGVDVNKDGFVCFQDFSRMMDVIPK